MTITATIAGTISMLAQLGMFFGRRRDNNSGLGIVGSLFMLVLAPLAAMIVQMAISRTPAQHAPPTILALVSAACRIPSASKGGAELVATLAGTTAYLLRELDEIVSQLDKHPAVESASWSLRTTERAPDVLRSRDDASMRVILASMPLAERFVGSQISACEEIRSNQFCCGAAIVMLSRRRPRELRPHRVKRISITEGSVHFCSEMYMFQRLATLTNR